jgi:phage-related tail fiber protein
MVHDTEFPSNWDNMNSNERSAWLAVWFDANVKKHQTIGKMNRAKAKAEWDAWREKNGRGKRRK